MTSDPSSKPPSSEPDVDPGDLAVGRWIRRALVIFPAGLVLLGAASFLVWQWKKDRADDRNLRYAAALRLEPTVEAWQKYRSVLDEVTAGQDLAGRLAATASYLASSMGEESMGYAVTRVDSNLPERASVIQVELTGRRRTRELVELVVLYGAAEPERAAAENRALASVLVLARWLTGEKVDRTVRISLLPLCSMSETAQSLHLEEIGSKDAMADHRRLFLDVFAAGPDAESMLNRLKQAFATVREGTVVTMENPPADEAEALRWVEAAQARLLKRAMVP
ncbi:MAG: hypothetical protein KDK99_20610 [Verrucomicrobiales bacterium]|nr:hypothetical protein [Verrucomicrobiales bacterium]